MKRVDQQLANTLKDLHKNTANRFSQLEIKNTLHNVMTIAGAQAPLLTALRKIHDYDFDLTGFGLQQVVSPGIYTFYNDETDAKFDVYTNYQGGEQSVVTIGYIDADGMEQDVDTIFDAISGYCS